MNNFFQNYSFQKDPDEEIVFKIHKHCVLLAGSFIKFFISLLIFFVAIYFIGPVRIFSSLVLSIIFAIWFLIMAVYIFYEWIVWWLDIYILTTKRVVDIEQITLFSRQVAETSLDRIQDITFEVKGVLATIYNYGTVKVETAGSETIISLDQVAEPEDIQKIIFKTADTNKSQFAQNPPSNPPDSQISQGGNSGQSFGQQSGPTAPYSNDSQNTTNTTDLPNQGEKN